VLAPMLLALAFFGYASLGQDNMLSLSSCGNFNVTNWAAN